MAGSGGLPDSGGSGGSAGFSGSAGSAGCPDPSSAPPACTAETPEGAECLLEDFESGSESVPDGWTAWEWSAAASNLGWTVDPDDECNHVATIASLGSANDARWERTYDLASDAYYTLTGLIRTEDVAGNYGASYTLTEEWDGCSPVMGTAPWTECAFTFGAGSTGSAGLTARLGHYSGVTNGTAWFDDLSLVRHQAVLGSHTRVMLEPVVLAGVKTSDLEAWMGRADQAYETYLGLVGASPKDGGALDVVSVRQPVAAAQSICAEQICWPSSKIAPDVEQAGAGGAWDYGTLLRLSELFDLDGRWTWNAEFFAALKAYHVTETLDVEVMVSSNPDVTYQGSDLVQYYQSRVVQGQVGVADLIVRFIEIGNTIGWQPFQDAFDYFRGLDPENVPTGFDRFDAFVDQLIASSGTNVLLMFTTPELVWVANVAE